MNLAKLKERLNQISASTHNEATFSFDTSDQNTYLHKISSRGNKPEDWIEYIDMVDKDIVFPSKLCRHNALTDLYEKAFKDIDSDANKTNEAFARLFVSYAKLKREFIPSDARLVFNQARAIVRRFAFVHLAAAQFEVDLGDKIKGKRILEKAFMFEAKPTEEIEIALKKLKEGVTQLYTSPVTIKRNPEQIRERIPSGDNNTVETSGPVKQHLVSGERHSVAGTKIEVEHFRLPAMVPEPSSVSRTGMRSYHSTPLLSSEKSSRQVKRNFGPPLRVKKVNLQFTEVDIEEEMDQNTMDSFKPLDKLANSTFGSTHAHTSGYLSMSQMTEGTSMMETNPTPLKQEKPTPLKPNSSLPKPKMEYMLSAPVEKPARTYLLEPQPPASVVKQKDIAPAENSRHAPLPPPASTPQPQSNFDMLTVSGQQYAVMDVIGKGGSSKVFRVYHHEHRLLAIKRVNLNNTDESIIQGYKNEIKLLERLQYCDRVIKMYDSEFDPEKNVLYVVMEQGSEDLATFFRRQTKDGKGLSSRLVGCYWEMMLQAVQALHKEGIIHSDLKPANFLLVGGNLKLIDFGIAKTIQQDKTSVILETQVGTLNFMSPETIMDFSGDSGEERGKPKFKISVSSDVWSLGCILYNMVYGKTPFQHLRKDFLKLQAIMNPDYKIDFPTIPNKYLLDVMQQCLERDPKKRPSIEELLVHPYLTLEAGEVIPGMADLSPTGLRNFLLKINPDTTPGPKVMSNDNYNPAHSRKAGSLTVKSVRAPLQSLNIHKIQTVPTARGYPSTDNT